MTIDRSKRTTFDKVAELYDGARPGYPKELVDDVLVLSEIAANGRILEIGCGPGNATVEFAKRGHRMLCIELGERFVALAVENCRAYPGVEIRNTSFEDWELDERAFDLAISASAFHWIPLEIGYPKVARALKDAGSLALFWHVYIDPETDLFEAIDKMYREKAPGLENPTRARTLEWVIERIEGNFEASRSFGEVVVRQYSGTETYTGERYIRLLETLSVDRSPDENTKANLFAGIREVIERFGGSVERPYVTVLFHAKVKRR